MARTPSQMLPLGTPAPEFNLPDPDGKLHSLDSAAGSRAYVVMFICNHCPFVKHVADELARLGRDYAEQGVAIFAINSNDVENYPDVMNQVIRAQSERVRTGAEIVVDGRRPPDGAWDGPAWWSPAGP